MPYRLRLRFRIGNRLKIDGNEKRFEHAGHTLVLTPSDGASLLSEADWLSFNVHSIPSQEAAAALGERLALATTFSSLCRLIGVDIGLNQATTMPGRALVDGLRPQGVILRPDVHGLDVFLDEPEVRFLRANFVMRVVPDGDPFIAEIEKALERLPIELPETEGAILLLNAALMSPEALAKLTLALAAVEMLSQKGATWSARQRDLLNRLARAATADTVLSPEERREVADAIERETHRRGLRQGVLRLLHDLGLPQLGHSWDEVYNYRSRVVHGDIKRPVPSENADWANRAVRLCGRIVLVAAVREGAYSPRDFETMFRPG